MSGKWIDEQGDIWVLGVDGLMHTPETAPFPREYVEKKWGPLKPLDAATPYTGTQPTYEYQTATKGPDGRIERVGVSFAEDEYPDARQRVMGEYYDIKRDAESFGSDGEVVLLRRPVSAWEVTDAE